MTHSPRKTVLLTCAGILGIALLVVLAVLNFLAGENSSPEFVYTVEWINIILVPLLVCIGVILAGFGFVKLTSEGRGKKLWPICCIVSAVLFLIPVFAPDYQHLRWEYQYILSGCWAGATLFAGLALFTAANYASGFAASLLCLFGSIALGFSALEIALLGSTQYADGMANLSAESRYAETEKGLPEYDSWAESRCGFTPAPPGKPLPAWHRLATFDHDLFDVKYTFNSRGFRALPQAREDAENDLILFGCSFTFGFGLEDEQTWPTLLARDLGPDWKLEDYSASGYSANQMLCMLERRLIQAPAGKHRLALFLAIGHQLRRNEFFPRTPHYRLNAKGEAEAGGNQRFVWAANLPHTFNGSQTAREIGSYITETVMKRPEKDIEIYLAMLKKSAQLLESEYDAKLIVFLWPDVANLEDRIEAMGIPVILAKPMLPKWDASDDPGSLYKISRYYEPHPNPEAAREIASGLARYFRDLAARDFKFSD